MKVGYEVPEEIDVCPIDGCKQSMKRKGSVMVCDKVSSHIVPLSTEIVEIEPNHCFIAGTTGTGKSKAMRRLIKECEGTILIIDAKRKRDYDDLNADIPLYIEQQMEAIVIKDSIETTERFSVRREFSTLLDMIAEATSWENMLSLIQKELETAKGYVRANLNILNYFLKRLVKEYSKYEWSKKLEIRKNEINVIDISKMGNQLQQLVVGSIVRYVLFNLTDVTVVIDEAHRFIPQGMTSGSSHDIITYVREGRASQNWLWVADQTVTGVSKDLLKQMQYWILGRQTELNEAQRSVKQIPRRKSLGVTVELIQTLGLGEFLVMCHEWAKKTYIWPLWIDSETAKKVALGEMTAKAVAKLEKQKEGEDDMVWKGKFEASEKERKKLYIENQKLVKEEQKKVQALEREREQLMKRVENFEMKFEGLLKERDTKTDPQAKEIKEEPNIESPEERVDDSADGDWKSKAEAWSVGVPRSDLIRLIDERLSQVILDSPRVVQVPLDDAIREKIMSDYMDMTTKNLQELKEPAKTAARFIYKGKRVPYGDLLFHIRNRRGKGDASFTRDYINPLTRRSIIAKEKGANRAVFLIWSVESDLLAHFQDILNPDEIKKLKDFVHSLIL